MTKKEDVYNYLSGWISNKSFRKWLLTLDNADVFFSESDFKQLKTFAAIFSNPQEVKNILQNYIDKSIVEKLALTKRFQELIEKDEDILVKLEKFGNIGKQLENKEITDFVKSYKEAFLNIPRLTEKKNWDEDIFLEKRKIVDKQQKEIEKVFVKFYKLYYFEYKEER